MGRSSRRRRGMRLRDLIARESGEVLAESSAGRRLGKLGLSPQPPLDRAHQQDPEWVKCRRKHEYPQIRAEARRPGATIVFADETTVRSDHHAGTTWAPVRGALVVTAAGVRFALNLISAVASVGTLRFRIIPGTITGPGSSTPAAGSAPMPAAPCSPSSMATRCTDPRRSPLCREHQGAAPPVLPAPLQLPAQSR